MPKEIPKWKKLMDDFETAVKEYFWIGGAHPATHVDTEKNYVETKAALVEYLMNSVQKSRVTEHIMGS